MIIRYVSGEVYNIYPPSTGLGKVKRIRLALDADTIHRLLVMGKSNNKPKNRRKLWLNIFVK